MKTIALILSILLFAACAQPKTIKGVEYRPYGLLNADEEKSPDIKYRISGGNIFWGVFLAETIIAPIYFFGFALYAPVGIKPKVKNE